MRRTIASCWKSLRPNTATSGRVTPSSLVTTVATPRKCPGRIGPSSRSASGPGSTWVWNPGGYIVAAVGAYTASTPTARHAARSTSIGRG